MKYFRGISTLEEVKKLYRELVVQYHPDVSGYDSTEEMQDINIQYGEALKNALSSAGKTNEEIKEEIQFEERYKEKFESISKLDFIVIELAYKWIWVSGGTYPHREKLKKCGLFPIIIEVCSLMGHSSSAFGPIT